MSHPDESIAKDIIHSDQDSLAERFLGHDAGTGLIDRMRHAYWESIERHFGSAQLFLHAVFKLEDVRKRLNPQ